uniref:Uncharacterized protein n=1 Tax=Kalanchoe fedtschenkoi TaxID=63787 RepID=A0A7N0TTT0_KALFE
MLSHMVTVFLPIQSRKIYSPKYPAFSLLRFNLHSSHHHLFACYIHRLFAYYKMKPPPYLSTSDFSNDTTVATIGTARSDESPPPYPRMPQPVVRSS